MVTPIPRAPDLHTAETVTTVARMEILLASVEDHKNGPTRMNSTLDTKKVDLEQDQTAESGMTPAQGTGWKAEGKATGVAEAIPVTDQHLVTATDPHPKAITAHPVEATDAVQPLTITHTTTRQLHTLNMKQFTNSTPTQRWHP